MKISKRILSAFTSVACSLTISAGALTIGVSAADNTVTTGDLTCKTYADHVEVIDCADTATVVSIPSEVYNLPVTVIADEAFADCTALTQVTIPDSVNTIGDKAFNGCSSLNSAAIPSSVTSIGAYVFFGTDMFKTQEGPVYYVSNWAVASAKATAVKIENGTVGIADSTFLNCGLETVNIPSSVITIGNNAFASNADIRTLTIPSGTKTIGSGAFSGCSSLLSVGIGSTVTDIGAGAFYNCSNLEGIKIPSSVTHIGQDAFAYTNDYKKQKGPEIYIDTWVVNCLDSEENLAVNIKNGTKGIADNAFYDKTFVISATIPSGVTTIGSYAFGGCTSLSQLSLPDTLTTIGGYAFANTSIPNVSFPSSVSNIGDSAFRSCSNLKSITVNNPKCAIYDSKYTFPDGATLYVFEKSTAYDYANKYSRSFDYISAGGDILLGDVSGNGRLDVNDAILIAKYILGKPLTEQQLKVGDFNNDGKVDLLDCIAIAKELVKK